MSGSADSNLPSDELLVAYLDGELPLEERAEMNRLLAGSEEARERLEFLRSGDRPFRDALDTLLAQAPMERMTASLSLPVGAEYQPAQRHAAPAASHGWVPMAAAAAVLLALVGGFVGGMLSPRLDATAPVVAMANEDEEEEDEPVVAERGWRQAVADYQVLFTSDSLTPFQGGESGLTLANAALGIPIDGVAADLDGLNFRRVQVLQFNGKPLVQLAYLSHDGKPVSFCIIASGKPEQRVEVEQRNGLEIVHWILAGYGFMVIGDISQEELEPIARDLMVRVGI